MDLDEKAGQGCCLDLDGHICWQQFPICIFTCKPVLPNPAALEMKLKRIPDES